MTNKIDIVIEWLLNDLPLLNKDVTGKLEDMLIGKLTYVKDSKGNTIRILSDE